MKMNKNALKTEHRKMQKKKGKIKSIVFKLLSV